MSASASMTMRAAAVALALPAHLSAAWPATPDRHVDRQAEAARRDQEATVLFATIVKDIIAEKGLPFETCEIEAEWNAYTIDYAIAHEAIGLEIHAALANPRSIAATSVILGTVAKDAICDKAARERYRASRIAAWETASKAVPSGSTPPERPFFTDTFFSYPLFDRDFRRAVLVYGRQENGRRLDEKGKPLLGLIRGFGSALVYARTGGTWHKVDRIYLYGTY